ncbi:MAG: cytochrome b/b6 domain-containing protein [Acidobacteria bacterium]|nr:cytochrome b/b6 domain-containing protein [Acidobacteriota bacterium]MCB9378615.1 cytochrome b/b6 domain-containing protein [Holophagales bacterium]
MNREYVYPAFGRFWHWAQAFLILFLALTGFEIHGSISFFGFEQAVRLHNGAAISFLVLIAFAIFWHFTTDEWRQYLPTWKNLRAQAEYYLFGIFQDAPHPTRKTKLRKLNPLQKLTYAGLKILVIPVVVVSGLFYMFYRYPQSHEVIALDVRRLEPIAWLHTAGAFALLAFLVAHLYLTTTGHTLFSNLKAMVTGWEEIHDDAPTTDAGGAS